MGVDANRQSARGGGNQIPSTLNPAIGGLANLFGIPIAGTPGGGLTIAPQESFILPSVFQPSDFADLGELAQPINPVTLDLEALTGAAQGGLNTISEAAQTGLIGPAQELFQQQFDETVAGLGERFGGFGLNSNDIDFQRALLREGQLGATQLANLAQDRRLQAASLLPSAAGSTLDLEQLARSAARSRTRAGQQFDLLQTLAGVNTQGQTAGTSFNRSSGSGFGVGIKGG